MTPARELISQTEHWFNRVVLGLNLCPFAHIPARENRVRVVAVEQEGEQPLLALLRSEIELLQLQSADVIETTLVVADSGFEDFHDYLGTLAYLENWLAAEGWEGFVQIASFHPQYQFANTLADDPANLTNRSPFPTFHLIREESLTAVIDNGADTDSIPVRNIARVSALTKAEKQALFPYLKS